MQYLFLKREDRALQPNFYPLKQNKLLNEGFVNTWKMMIIIKKTVETGLS